jgi:hypothetical protein
MRNAWGVRFVNFEIRATGVLARECALSSCRFCLVQARRFRRRTIFAARLLFFAMLKPPC